MRYGDEGIVNELGHRGRRGDESWWVSVRHAFRREFSGRALQVKASSSKAKFDAWYTSSLNLGTFLHDWPCSSAIFFRLPDLTGCWFPSIDISPFHQNWSVILPAFVNRRSWRTSLWWTHRIEMKLRCFFTVKSPYGLSKKGCRFGTPWRRIRTRLLWCAHWQSSSNQTIMRTH